MEYCGTTFLAENILYEVKNMLNGLYYNHVLDLTWGGEKYNRFLMEGVREGSPIPEGPKGRPGHSIFWEPSHPPPLIVVD